MKKYLVNFLQVPRQFDRQQAFEDVVDADYVEVKQGVLLFYERGINTSWLIRAYNDWQNVKEMPEEQPRQRLEIRDVLSATNRNMRRYSSEAMLNHQDRPTEDAEADYVGDVELS
jgi:hypothetical protein